MQTKKTDISKIILKVSRIEFLKNGFKNASMRNIAKNSGVGLSNIYNYYKNKDEIFLKVLSPLMNALNKMMQDHNSSENLTLDVFYSDKYFVKQANWFTDLVITYKEELKLLLFQSYGSSLENYRDDYTDQHTKIGLEYIIKMKEKYPQVNTNISDFFIHTVSSWSLSIIGEIVTHDLKPNEIQQFITEYIEFATAGWKKIMRV